MQLHAAGAERERGVAPRPPLSEAGGWQALLLSESRALLAGPPPLFQALSSRERELVPVSYTHLTLPTTPYV